MSRNTPARYRATRITLAVGTGIAVVAGGVFLAGNGNNGASTGTDTSAIVATDGASAATVAPSTPAVAANSTRAKDDGEHDDSDDSSKDQATSAEAQPTAQATTQATAQATAQPTASIQKSRVSRGS